MSGLLNAAVFASGSGTNFQALLDREGQGALWRTRLLIVDRPETGAAQRAEKAGIPVRHIAVKDRDPHELGAETVDALQDARADVILLAGYTRMVPSAVCSAFPKRMVNVHPALLPAFGGKGMWGSAVHRAVLAAGVRVTGVTVHFVSDRYDEGGILAQWPVPVLPGDDVPTLAARVLAVEHQLYPLAVQELCRALASGKQPAPLAPPPAGFGSSSLAAISNGAFQST